MYTLASSSGIFMLATVHLLSGGGGGGGGGALVGSEWGPCQKIRLQRAGLAKKY